MGWLSRGGCRMSKEQNPPGGGCWYGEAHGPFVRTGYGTNTAGHFLYGPPHCVRCGALLLPVSTPEQAPDDGDPQRRPTMGEHAPGSEHIDLSRVTCAYDNRRAHTTERVGDAVVPICKVHTYGHVCPECHGEESWATCICNGTGFVPLDYGDQDEPPASDDIPAPTNPTNEETNGPPST